VSPCSREYVARTPLTYTEALGTKKGKNNLQRMGIVPRVPIVGESDA
jgi:hypothetical protein